MWITSFGSRNAISLSILRLRASSWSSLYCFCRPNFWILFQMLDDKLCKQSVIFICWFRWYIALILALSKSTKILPGLLPYRRTRLKTSQQNLMYVALVLFWNKPKMHGKRFSTLLCMHCMYLKENFWADSKCSIREPVFWLW